MSVVDINLFDLYFTTVEGCSDLVGTLHVIIRNGDLVDIFIFGQGARGYTTHSASTAKNDNMHGTRSPSVMLPLYYYQLFPLRQELAHYQRNGWEPKRWYPAPGGYPPNGSRWYRSLHV